MHDGADPDHGSGDSFDSFDTVKKDLLNLAVRLDRLIRTQDRQPAPEQPEHRR